MKAKLKFLLMSVGLVLLLSACRASVKSERQMLQYANDRYGNGTLIKTEYIDDRKTVVYLRDNEYGFEYTVTSSVADISVDGAKFGESETTTSTFVKSFREFILQQSQEKINSIEQEYHIRIEVPDILLHCLVELNGCTEDNAQQASAKTAEIFKSFDARNFFEKYTTDAFDGSKNLLGKYNVSNGEWKNLETLEQEDYLKRAKMMNRSAEFVRKEKKIFLETGLDLSQVYQPLGRNDFPKSYNSQVIFYYFQADGKEFFIADFNLKETGRCYTNYEEIFT